MECDAVDSLGPIFRAEYAVNGGDFRIATSDDGLLDSAREHIRVVLDANVDVPAGATSVLVAVRATDANGNAAVGEVEVMTRSERTRP